MTSLRTLKRCCILPAPRAAMEKPVPLLCPLSWVFRASPALKHPVLGAQDSFQTRNTCPLILRNVSYFFDLLWVVFLFFCLCIFFLVQRLCPLNFLVFYLFSFYFYFFLLLGMFPQLLTLLLFFTHSATFDFQELICSPHVLSSRLSVLISQAH